MKKILLLTAFAGVSCLSEACAQIRFSSKIVSSTSAFSRMSDSPVIYELSLESSVPADTGLARYKVSIISDGTKTTMLPSDFSIDFKEVSLLDLNNSYKFYLKLNPRPKVDDPREIHLNLKISHPSDETLSKIKNDEVSPGLIVKIDARTDTLKAYDYLAYIGTNFDFVDGVKPSNLYLATHIFKLPKVDPKFSKLASLGFSLLLYGNRTYIAESSTTEAFREIKNVSNSKDSLVYEVTEGTIDVIQNTTSDNIGIAYSSIIPLQREQEKKRNLYLYLAPQIEFIWRRGTVSQKVSNLKDTTYSAHVVNEGSPIRVGPKPVNDIRTSSTYNFNVAPLCFFLVHESGQVSVRIQPYIFALSFNYIGNVTSSVIRTRSVLADPIFSRNFNFSSGVRVWITEAVSGITLAGEFSNRMFNNYLPFFNVTLSKALSFKNIGSIFAPVTAR